MNIFATTLAISQDVDLGRVVVVILFLLGGFVQWLIKWWKARSAGTAPNFNAAEKIEELKARSKAWLKQTGQSKTPGGQPPPVTPIATANEARQSNRRRKVQPPPLPSSSPDRIVRNVAPVVESPPVRRSHPLMEQIASIGGLKRAIMLNEILGPPKALQGTDDHLSKT